MILRRLSLGALALLLAAPALQAKSEAEPLERAAGRLLLIGVRGDSVDADSDFEHLVCGLKIGGILLFDKDALDEGAPRNVTSKRQLSKLTRDLQALARRCGDAPLLIAADVEGGVVNRLSALEGLEGIARHLTLGRGPTRATYDEARKIGRAMARAGVNWDLAPVVDVNLNPDSPAIGRWGRAFSDDGETVSLHARSFIRGLAKEGVLNCIKHFPGHGSSTDDSHLGAVDVTDTADLKAELDPYRRLLNVGLVDCVMPGHLYNRALDAERMATFSSATIQGLLRRELNYDGLVLTDDLQMHAVTDHQSLEKAAVQAVLAGADMITVSNNRNRYDETLADKIRAELLDSVRRGELDEARLREASARVLALKRRLRR